MPKAKFGLALRSHSRARARALSLSVAEMHDTIRKGLVYELLSAQDKVLCSYYAQRGGQRHQPRHQGMSLDDLLTKLS